MAAQYKTQCPHCGAQFRISEQHLAQAKGAVRCGSCLKVFQATDHIIQDTPAASRPAAPRAGRPPAAAAKPAATPEQWTMPEEAKPASRWTLDDNLSDEMDDAMPDKLVDEPAKPDSALNDTRVSMGSLELSDSFMSLDSDDDSTLRDESFSDMAGAGKKVQSEDSDESWAEKLLEELEEGDKPAPVPVRADTLTITAKEEEKARRQRKSAPAVTAAPAAATASARKADDSPDWAMDSGDFFSDSALDILSEGTDEIAAIDLPTAEERRPPRVNIPMEQLTAHGSELLKWGALSLAAVLVLAAQYLVFNFNELSRNAGWRPFYANVCGAVGCKLPSISDVGRLRGSNLVVRGHPQVADALVVDVIVTNDGQHPQPFPLLELGFTSLNGRAIASRRFLPEEYLRGDLKGMELMPTGVPIRLSLEILDPGGDAVNYTLRFFPAPSAG
ncbi:MAG: DUF3426 domain-containing protein [Alcanivoracaceae bacterium]